jgi:serine O-acetyltransferase
MRRAPSVIKLLASDMRRARLLPTADNVLSVCRVVALPFYYQVRVLFLVRCATSTRRLVRLVARVILRSLYSIEVGDNVTIGVALRLPHPQGIIIGDGARIGDEVSIGQFVTIGGNFRKQRSVEGGIQKLPIIGSRVVISPGAVVAGPISIGNDVVVGANSVITKDIPSNRIAFGNSELSRMQIAVDPTGSYSYLSCTETEARGAGED